MAKEKNIYVCSACGFESAKWLGKCPGCEDWGTLEETVVSHSAKTKTEKTTQNSASVQRLLEVETLEQDRFLSGSKEFDRVLGGGIVPASIVLCGGDPGIGKSTLLLQVCAEAAKTKKVLYISAEESVRQIKLRADRLSCKEKELYVCCETDIEEICTLLILQKPAVAVIDSIQTVFASYLSSAPGTVTQVRECATRLMRVAKEYGITIFVVGHVTKEGTLAGPKVLEHIVDTVMYFEGERNSSFRVLRTNKNRFGSTNEIGVFEMTELGMRDVENPSEIFVSERKEVVPGVALTCSCEGTRPLMVEIQALCGLSSFGNPRRVGSGVDYNRMVTLLAVLEKRMGISIYNKDVYVSIAGGLRIDEPASDLAMLASVFSAEKNLPILPSTVLLGEVGLTGELRAVSNCQVRIAECKKLGFKRVILPKQNKRGLKSEEDMQMFFVDNVFAALSFAIDSKKG